MTTQPNEGPIYWAAAQVIGQTGVNGQSPAERDTGGMSQFLELQIAAAAIEWETSRREALRLKQVRNALKCSERSDTEYDENGRETYPGDPPCWEVQTRPEGDSLPLEQRCEMCQQNHVAHAHVKKAIADCGGKLRRLRRLLAKTIPERETGDGR